MRYTAIIGSQADYIQHQSIKPKYYPPLPFAQIWR